MRCHKSTIDWILGGHALEMFNKGRENELSKRKICILTFINAHQPLNNHTLTRLMSTKSASIDHLHLTSCLNDLQACNYVARDDKRYWSITPAGIDILQQFETQLRKERIDK